MVYHFSATATMTNIFRSVRKLMPHGSGDDEEEVVAHQQDHKKVASTEFRPLEKAKSVLNRARSLSRHSDIDTEYMEAPYPTTSSSHNDSVKALSPTSASSANANYHLMDHNDEGDGRQGPPSTEPEGIQQSLNRVQRRVSDSWKSLQGVSKRLVTRSSSSTDNFLLHGAADLGESRQDMEDAAVHHDHRFLRKAVRNMKKSLGRHAVEGNSTVPSTEGYVRHREKNESVVFAPPAKDMVAA
uniref:Uncharacterized protein n=1 Tax=Amphora coffeiformis TaxID=265554 RepID=A0A7S3KZX1_9STRA